MDILYLSPADWSGPTGRFQQIALRLARTNRVLYADGLGLRPIGLRDWRRCSSKVLHWFRPAAARPNQNGDLYCITPLAIPSQRIPAVQHVNRSLLKSFVSRHLERNGFCDLLVWIAYPHPDLVAILDHFRPRAVVYDCVDHWPGFKRVYDNLASSEEKLVRRADLIFATAKLLQAKWSQRNPRCFLVPNGVDIESFATNSPSTPSEFARIPAPRIGFVGNIDERTDLELVRKIARIRSDWQLVFVGEYRAIAPRPDYKNIHWLGYRPYDNLADYVASFDVCIIPFVVDELTRAADPLKLYQYLAAGKPVVSTPIPRSSDFVGVVRIAGGAKQFVSAIDEALDDRESGEQRVAAVRQHSWAERMNEIVNLVRQHLAIELRQ